MLISSSNRTDADLVGLWNEAVGTRHPLTASQWEAMTRRDPGFVPTDLIAAEREGELAGFVLTKRYRGDFPGCGPGRTTGWITLLAVAPAHQRQGVGRALVEAASTALRAAGATRLGVGGSFHHAMPGIPAWSPEARALFEATGFTLGSEAWDVRRDLSEVELPPLALPAGVEARLWDDGDALVRYLMDHFPGRWARDVSLGLEQGEAMGRVMGVFEAELPLGFCWLHPPGSLGAARWAGFSPDIAALGPIGVSEAARGRGLGLALLVAGLQQLQHWGARDTVIDWTTLLDFYARVGFAPWLRYTLASKPLI